MATKKTTTGSKKLYVGSPDGKYIWGMAPATDIDKICNEISTGNEEGGVEEITIYELGPKVGVYFRDNTWAKK